MDSLLKMFNRGLIIRIQGQRK